MAFLVNGKEYGSPSAAGSAVMGGVSCNGWRFWTPEGQETKTAKKAGPKTKSAKKAAPKGKRAGKAKKGRKVVGGANGEEPEPVKKPVSCGECHAEFPSSRLAADHMRDQHNSLEAAGTGGR